MCTIGGVQISEMTITFNAKINSVTSSSTVSSSQFSTSSSSSSGFCFFVCRSSSFTSSYSSQQTNRNSNKEEREFSLSVFVRAVQDDMPSGMEKILDILEEAIYVAAQVANS
jgi:Protein of unknown function (DUF2589)